MQRVITLEQFSGPLDALLAMVEEERLSINEISLSQIADQYIAQIKQAEEFSKEELAAFLVIAATLILIKSRSLLPHLTLTSKEEESIDELQQRLRVFQFFKMLAGHLNEFQRQRLRLVGREAYAGLQMVFMPPDGITVQHFSQALQALIHVLPMKEYLPSEIIEKAITLEEKIEEIRTRVERALYASFDDIKKHAKEKIEVIVAFLALLELVKQGALIFEQRELFGNIKLNKRFDG